MTILAFCFYQTSEASTVNKEILQDIDGLEANIDSLMNKTTIPGVAVAIVSQDSILWICTYGYADLESHKPVSENTQFCIGSCTKSFTGLGILALFDKKQISLETPVKQIAPEITIQNPWSNTHPVRVINLVEHTSGFEDSHINWFYFNEPIKSLKEALEDKAHLRKVRWKPGTRFCYSSPGFTLAGYIIEKLSGQKYSEYITQTLLKPIGMNATTIGSSEKYNGLVATGYDKDNNPFPTYYDYDEPAGALNSSVKEMALFVQFMLNKGSVNGKQIMSESLFDRIGKPKTTLASNAGIKSGYSFGIGTRYEDGEKWLGHSGAVPGFLAEYYVNPDQGFGFVVMQNSFDMSFYDDVFYLVWDFMNEHIEPAEIDVPSKPLSTTEYEKYCGYYEARNPRMRLMQFADILSNGVTILCENNTLYYKPYMGLQRPLLHVSDNLFRRKDDPEATRIFFEDNDGQLVYASQSAYYVKTASWKPVVYNILVFGGFIIMFSAIVYALIWIPIYIYKRIKHKDNIQKYIWMRLVPLFAVLSLVVGTLAIFISGPTMLELGKCTLVNVIFFISTLFFAGFSVVSVYTTYRSFFKPVKSLDRIYAVILTVACFSMTLYLGYWGIIGLRMWVY